jgi:hypothetical protein
VVEIGRNSRSFTQNQTLNSTKEIGEIMEKTKKSLMDYSITFGIIIGIILVLAFGGGILFRVFCVTKVDNYEFAFSYNWWNGKIERIDRTGWIIRPPLMYSVHTIDTRPYQISITAGGEQNSSGVSVSSSAGGIASRVLNAKLVRFNPEGLSTFLEWHGRSGADSMNQLTTLMRCYAFDASGGKDCPFITILSELTPGQTGPVNTNQIPHIAK